MKKEKANLIVFILFIVISMIFVACSNLEESTVNIDELDIVEGIYMSEVSLADKRLTFTLINETDETIYYGEYITLEKHKNGKWYAIPLSGDIGFVGILNYLSPHSEDKDSYPIEAWENVSAGKYRFIKEFYIDEKLKDTKYMYIEFELLFNIF